MAMESPCLLRIGREQYEGTARLDADHIDFAGATKFRFRFSEIRAPGESDGELTFMFHGHPVRIAIRTGMDKWLSSIMHPQTITEKLGIKAGHAVRLLNLEDPNLIREIHEADARVLNGDGGKCDFIIMSAERPAELGQLVDLAQDVGPDGAIWVVLPKSSKNITHANVLAAAREAGLADTKSVSYSDTMSAYRVVSAPRTKRTAARKTTARRRTTAKSK